MIDLLTKQNHCWVPRLEHLSPWINPHHNLERRIEWLVTKKFLSSEDRKELERAFQVADGWVWPAGRMKRLIQKCPKNIFINY